MSSSSAVMGVLQRLGRSLMLPIAVLPAAALLLRFGQPDMLGSNGAEPGGLADVAGFGWMANVAKVFANAGDVLFGALPLLFAIGVAIGFARKADGSTAVAALVGYLIFDRVSKGLFFDAPASDVVHQRVAQQVVGADGKPVEVVNWAAGNPTGVLGGIMIGIVAALLWQRYYRIKLPTWLAFFGGRRFVPIVTALAGVLLGVVFGLIWPPIGEVMNNFGSWLADNNVVGAGVYGTANRLLIPLGLHHIINSIVWFQVPGCVVGGAQFTGDLTCYLQGADGAGSFMTGFFPVMMFGLPAAAIAIWRAAPAHRRTTVGGIMISAALVSFVTGITEPIEFAFIFVAPVLFVVHALLTGLSMALTTALDGRLGFGFSAGASDALLNIGKANTHNFWLVMLIGVIYAAVYYLVFSFLIRRLNIMTPGREPEPDVDSGESVETTQSTT
ncbi:PTS sugar transporter subunit IIA [Acrocarpospora corrugata]|uniref:PTS sugar transporter subunit IIA n=1 Tax=Acrocarpospora corrugata TaxID=35763 RepID=A0A5M3W489_9ACTN|nr:PTS transporter subunit EIIC [Acrocarpospora corrugata]GES02832.1 PTS sugar transporter subunit IIA [Acrocarpospora corrugata]